MVDLLSSTELALTPSQAWTAERLYHHLASSPSTEGVNLFLSAPDLDFSDRLPPSEPLDDQIWKERLHRASAGDRPGGLMRTIRVDFPVQNVPWERLLRRHMTQPLLRGTQVNWNRPNRRTLSLNSEIYEPSVRPREGILLAGVVVDTSASIDQRLLMRFASEIQGIQNRTGCNVYLISADAAVQAEDLIKNDGISFERKVATGSIKFVGGGGTYFYPALQRMKEKRVSAVVYLTDLDGDFGEETQYPFRLLWASTEDEVAPFGTTIRLC